MTEMAHHTLLIFCCITEMMEKFGNVIRNVDFNKVTVLAANILVLVDLPGRLNLAKSDIENDR